MIHRFEIWFKKRKDRIASLILHIILRFCPLLSNIDIVMNVKNVWSWLMVWYMALNYCCSSCNFSYVFYWVWTCFWMFVTQDKFLLSWQSLSVYWCAWCTIMEVVFPISCFTWSKWDWNIICKCMWHEVYVLCAFCHLGSVLQIITCNYNHKHKENWLPVGRAV